MFNSEYDSQESITSNHLTNIDDDEEESIALNPPKPESLITIRTSPKDKIPNHKIKVEFTNYQSISKEISESMLNRKRPSTIQHNQHKVVKTSNYSPKRSQEHRENAFKRKELQQGVSKNIFEDKQALNVSQFETESRSRSPLSFNSSNDTRSSNNEISSWMNRFIKPINTHFNNSSYDSSYNTISKKSQQNNSNLFNESKLQHNYSNDRRRTRSLTPSRTIKPSNQKTISSTGRPQSAIIRSSISYNKKQGNNYISQTSPHNNSQLSSHNDKLNQEQFGRNSPHRINDSKIQNSSNQKRSSNPIELSSWKSPKKTKSESSFNNSIRLKTPVSKFLMDNNSNILLSPTLSEFLDSTLDKEKSDIFDPDLNPKSKPFLNATLSVKNFVVIENLLNSKLKLHHLLEKREERLLKSKTLEHQLNPLDESATEDETGVNDNIESILTQQLNQNSGTESNLTIHLLYILYIAAFLQRVKDLPTQAYSEIYNQMLQGEFWKTNIVSRKDIQEFIVAYLQQVCFEAFENIGLSPSSTPKFSSTLDPYFARGFSEVVNQHVKNDVIFNQISPKRCDIVIAVVSIAFLWIWTKRETDARSLLKIVFERKKDYRYRIPKREIAWMYYLVGESYMQEMFRHSENENQTEELKRQALFWFDRSVTLSNNTCWLSLTRRSILRMVEDPVSSLKDLTNSITLVPYHPENYYHRALLLPHINTTQNELNYTRESAIRDLTAIILMKGDFYYEALLTRSDLFDKSGKKNLALQDLTVAIQSFPKKPLAYFNRSKLLKEKSPQQAIIDLTIAISILPKPEYYFERASSSEKLSRYGDSLSDYTSCIRISKSAKALFKRASLLAKLKKYDLSIKDLTEAIILDSSKAKYFAKRALILFKNKRSFKNALNDFTEAISRDRINPQHYNNRGLLYTQLSRYNEALDDFNTAIELNPEYAAAYMNRAKLFLKMGRDSSALKDMEYACEFDPQNDYFRFCKSGLYTRNGTIDEQGRVFAMPKQVALNDINEAISISEDKGKPNHLYFARRAAFEKMESSENHIKDISKAIELLQEEKNISNQTLSEYHIQRAHSYESIGDINNSFQDLNLAIELYNENPSYFMYRAAFLMKYKESLSMIDNLEDIAREDAKRAQMLSKTEELNNLQISSSTSLTNQEETLEQNGSIESTFSNKNTYINNEDIESEQEIITQENLSNEDV